MTASQRRWESTTWLVLGVALAGLVTAFVPEVRQALGSLLSLASTAAIRRAVHGLGPWGPVALIAIMVVHGVTFIPSEIIVIAGVVVFGPFWGVVYAWIGSMLSAYLSFYLARVIGRPIVARVVAQDRWAKIEGVIRKHGSSGLFLLRLIPFVSFNALNYASGLTNLSFLDYTWATGLGILPAAIAIALLYKNITESKDVLIAVGVAALLIAAGMLGRLWLRHRRRPQGQV